MADVAAELIALLIVAAALATLAHWGYGWPGVAWTLAGYAGAVLVLAIWLALARV